MTANKQITMLEYMRRQLDGTLAPNDAAQMHHPPAIWKTLGFRLVAVSKGEAAVETNADPAKHGNQQGTIHGGFLCELADAAIGAAHSTLMGEGESFATVELKINYFRPSWETMLRAEAKPMQSGKTLTHYRATITRADGKTAAIITSTVITLRGGQAKGR